MATAGADGDVHLFDRAAELVLATLQGHSKKVNGRPRSGCVEKSLTGARGSHKLSASTKATVALLDPSLILLIRRRLQI